MLKRSRRHSEIANRARFQWQGLLRSAVARPAQKALVRPEAGGERVGRVGRVGLECLTKLLLGSSDQGPAADIIDDDTACGHFAHILRCAPTEAAGEETEPDRTQIWRAFGAAANDRLAVGRHASGPKAKRQPQQVGWAGK